MGLRWRIAWGRIVTGEISTSRETVVKSDLAAQYDRNYYDGYGEPERRGYSRANWMTDFERTADQIVRRLNPKRTLDVGCAKGFLVECLRDRGVEAFGFDISEYAIGEVRSDIRPYCWVGLASNSINENYDLITCHEVCEHLPEHEAAEAIREMTSHSDAILFSSTPGHFEDPTHLNVRPIIDWVRLFAQFSFAPDEAFDAGFVTPWAILFRRAAMPPVDEKLRRFAHLKTRAFAAWELKNAPEFQTELDRILSSKGWRLLNVYRNARARVKEPIKRAVRLALKGHLSYSRWIRRIERRTYKPAGVAREIAAFEYKPKISVVMPAYNSHIEFLDAAIQSVLRQQYENWELCICDDASPKPEVRTRLRHWQKQDARIKIVYSEKNEGISEASNRCLAMATGEFVALLDHDDEITPQALYEVAKLLQGHRDADMIYSDEDRLDPRGKRVTPYFKPGWSPELMLAVMYTCHFGVYRRRLLEEIGGFRVGFDGAQDYDLVLRLSEKTQRIHHIPKILYHWRMAQDSMARPGVETKPYAISAAQRALAEHLRRRGIVGDTVEGAWRGSYRVRFRLERADKVSIVISADVTEDALRRCQKSIEEKTTYPNYEVLVTIEEPVNLSRRINGSVLRASGEYILLLRGDTEVISPRWIEAMLGFCRQEEIGAVGARLVDHAGRIQHIGIVLGLCGLAGYPLRGFRQPVQDCADPSQLMRNCSAVSGACMMIRRRVFEEAGGFDEQMPDAYADVDLCLRIRQAGYRIVFTPDAELYCDEPSWAQHANGSEAKQFMRRWQAVLKDDPYYNPNLTLRHLDFGFRA